MKMGEGFLAVSCAGGCGDTATGEKR